MGKQLKKLGKELAGEARREGEARQRAVRGGVAATKQNIADSKAEQRRLREVGKRLQRGK